MGLIHTPRTIAALARGLYARRSNKKADERVLGLGPKNPHSYIARAGLLDVDYLGHMNNAAYLTHAELARWELTAVNDLLKVMVQERANFIVASSTIRYRREIRPIFRKFQIDSYVAGLDERSIWMMQNFRYPIEGNDRVRAQLMIRGMVVKDRSVLDPRIFFRDSVGFDKDLIDQLSTPPIDPNSEKADQNLTIAAVIKNFSTLDESWRAAAEEDDEWHDVGM